MSVSVPNEFGVALVKALGLPAKTIAVDIRVRVGEVPRVTVECYLGKDAADALATEVRNYEIVRRDPSLTEKQGLGTLRALLGRWAGRQSPPPGAR